MEVSFDPKFITSVNELDPNDAHRIWRSIEQFQKNPDHPGLNVEMLQGRAGRQRFWTMRASQELRILFAREGSTVVLLRAGHHEDIYDLAQRAAFFVPVAGGPGLIGIQPEAMDLDGVSPIRPHQPSVQARQGPSILEHWTDAEIQRAGFDRRQIELLRQATEETLFDVWDDISDEQMDLVIQCAEQSPEQWFNPELTDDGQASRFRDAILKRGALAGLSPLLSPEELRRLVAAPIEEWMIFLHPDQRALVDRRFSGPARVRGSAGTGKTVVALHRAAALAKRLPAQDLENGAGAAILFTTFIRSLPPIFENLYRRLPTAVPDAVEFINIHRLANRICSEAGDRPLLNINLVRNAFNDSFKQIVRPGTPLAHAKLTRRYLQDEVTELLKGRGVDSLDEYLAMERTGRRTPMTTAMREQTWRLREDWDDRLRSANVVDFPDVVRRARDLVRRRPQPTYRAAIIDEAQDLTLVGLQLVQAIVSGENGRDEPDALFIVGDGAQKIYPGGFTLAQAGVDVRGNSTVLRVNYRNTRQILDAAMGCVGAESVDDHGDRYLRGEPDPATTKNGDKPVLVTRPDFDAQVTYVIEETKRLLGARVLGLGDIGVLAPNNRLVKRALEGLAAGGLTPQPLTNFEGLTNDRIKVGTFDRAKGLEFKVVFLLGMSNGPFPAPRGRSESEAEYSERQAMEKARLFVAMTRARDGLYVLTGDNPSDFLYAGLDYLDELEG